MQTTHRHHHCDVYICKSLRRVFIKEMDTIYSTVNFQFLLHAAIIMLVLLQQDHNYFQDSFTSSIFYSSQLPSSLINQQYFPPIWAHFRLLVPSIKAIPRHVHPLCCVTHWRVNIGQTYWYYRQSFVYISG